MVSSLFRQRTPFNAGSNKVAADYYVHPWIAKCCVPHSKDLVPNPTVAQFFDAQDGTNTPLHKYAADPLLRRGDVVKTVGYVKFTNGELNWTMALTPMQVFRVGKGDKGLATSKYDDVESSGWRSLPTDGEKLQARACKYSPFVSFGVRLTHLFTLRPILQIQTTRMVATIVGMGTTKCRTPDTGIPTVPFQGLGMRDSTRELPERV